MARLVIGRTWCPAAVWHARKAADAESVDSEYLACVRLAGQRVVVEVALGNVGQLDGIESRGRANRLVVSGAYGGFSNVWGAQTMPWSAATFEQWPVKWSDMEPHYRSVLDEVPLSGMDDDLSELFPLLADAQNPPELAERSRTVLDRYTARRAVMRDRGITVGMARLALDAQSCVRCGLCMTGCPYSLVYSASHTFDRLRAAGRVNYVPGMLAYRVGERAGRPFADFRELRTGRTERLEADRVFVACGAIGTTRLVLGSLGHFGRDISLSESVQFVCRHSHHGAPSILDRRTTSRSTSSTS